MGVSNLGKRRSISLLLSRNQIVSKNLSMFKHEVSQVLQRSLPKGIQLHQILVYYYESKGDNSKWYLKIDIKDIQKALVKRHRKIKLYLKNNTVGLVFQSNREQMEWFQALVLIKNTI